MWNFMPTKTPNSTGTGEKVGSGPDATCEGRSPVGIVVLEPEAPDDLGCA